MSTGCTDVRSDGWCWTHKSWHRGLRPRLLDLFCGAGGAAEGYTRAGFEVVGVDIAPQPNYLFEFHQADAIEVLRGVLYRWDLQSFDAIHASPPCHDHSSLSALSDTHGTGWLLEETIRLAKLTGLPWVVENVVGKTVKMDGTWFTLCGSMFDLGVRRHRRFGSSFHVLTPTCRHREQPEPIDVSGTGARRIGERLDGGGGNSRKPRNLAEAREAMGIDWMTRRELSQAVPPAFTEYIGQQLMAQIKPKRPRDLFPVPYPDSPTSTYYEGGPHG